MIRTAWTHIRRSPYQAMAAVLTLFLTFLLGGIFALTTGTSLLIIRYFESKPQMTVFFSEKAGKAEADVLERTLRETGKVASVKFVSKEQALEIYKKQNKNDPLLLEMVTADILPASLEVSTTDPRFLHELEPIIKKGEGVEEVVFQKDVVDTLLSWTNAVKLVGGGLAAFLALDSLLVIITIIGMKIAVKREEIDILKLIGASPWYIRFPFVTEGGIYGMIGAFIAWTIIMAFMLWQRSALNSFLGMIPEIHKLLASPVSPDFLLPAVILLAAMTATGFFLGALGSMFALGRYIRF